MKPYSLTAPERRTYIVWPEKASELGVSQAQLHRKLQIMRRSKKRVGRCRQGETAAAFGVEKVSPLWSGLSRFIKNPAAMILRDR